jgi:RNA polymerase sigma factor (sigma-70 family)
LILKKKSSVNYAVTPVNEGDTGDFEFSIEEKLIESEQTKVKAQKIRQVVNDLPQRQKEIIYLKFFQDLGRDEIAEILHLNPQTVSNHLQTDIKSMRLHKELILLTTFLLVYILQLYF